jgi:hypothetical protein
LPLYTTLASLSQTAASNVADGSVDAPSTIDQQTNLLASFIAQLRDGVNGPFTAWTATSPTPTPETGAFTSASTALRYKLLQKTLFFNLVVFLNTIGTGSGAVKVTLPGLAAADSAFGGKEIVTSGIGLSAFVPGASNVLVIYKYDGASAIANSYRLVVNGVMEVL